MVSLLLACGLFIGLHTLVSGTALRARLIRTFGLRLYATLFSLCSLTSIVWVTRAYHYAFVEENAVLWEFGMGLRHAAGPVMFVAFLLAVVGVLSPSPAGFGQGGLLERTVQARGIHRITRHPFLWGIVLWAAIHLGVNGDQASVTLFSTFLLVAVLGASSRDRKRADEYGRAWAEYVSQTSSVPFLAIAQRRNQLRLGEIGAWRVAAAIVAFGAVVLAHPWLFGAYPLPGMGAWY